MSYTNWRPGRPSDTAGVSNCVEMLRTTGEWDDRRCSTGLGYICKKPGGTSYVASTKIEGLKQTRGCNNTLQAHFVFAETVNAPLVLLSRNCLDFQEELF